MLKKNGLMPIKIYQFLELLAYMDPKDTPWLDTLKVIMKLLLKNLNDRIINISDLNKVKSYDAIKFVLDKLELK